MPLIRPISSARAGSSRGLSRRSPSARRRPTSLGSRNVELSAPVSPVLEYAHSNATRGDANTRSQDIARLQVAEIAAVAARPDVLQVGAAAEDAAAAAQHDRADRLVARALERGAPQILCGLHVERIEPCGAVDGDDRDRAGSL